MATRKEKTEHLAACKRARVLLRGCEKCRCGRLEGGFEKYWEIDHEYDARRFVFKYADLRESDVPVAKLPRQLSSSLDSINEALSRCVILCRTCADPRRKSSRKDDDRCQTQPTSETSPSSS